MKRNAIPFTLLLAILFAVGCSNPTKSDNLPDNTYFDLKAYFLSEIDRLEQLNPTVEKKVLVQEQEESKEVADIDWRKEFQIFLKNDLTKPGYKGKFDVTENESSDGSKTTTYKAIKAATDIQQVDIYSKNDQINRVLIQRHVDNTSLSSKQTLEYIPDSVYVIKNSQQIAVMGKEATEVIGKF